MEPLKEMGKMGGRPMRRGSKNDIAFEANSEEAGLQKGMGSLRAVHITDSLRLTCI